MWGKGCNFKSSPTFEVPAHQHPALKECKETYLYFIAMSDALYYSHSMANKPALVFKDVPEYMSAVADLSTIGYGYIP